MAIDGDIASVIGVCSAVASGCVTYGIMKEKIRRIEKETEESDHKYVSLQVYNAVIPPLQSSVFEIQKDIKKILQILNKTSRKEE